ncbi:hypothetical protein ACRS6P_23255 [Pseudomonas aeruginosa]
MKVFFVEYVLLKVFDIAIQSLNLSLRPCVIHGRWELAHPVDCFLLLLAAGAEQIGLEPIFDEVQNLRRGKAANVRRLVDIPALGDGLSDLANQCVYAQGRG